MTTIESKSDKDGAAPSASLPSAEPSNQQRHEDVHATVTVSDQPPATPASPGKLDRTASTAIGPSSDQPMPVAKDTEGPVLVITLLLTNGARHPFKLDSKYLTKRNVSVTENDPFNMSVYTLKELILREWREEWEQKPTNASSIRLISFGKLLEDKNPLKDSRFSHDSPNVVHMTIKPQEIVDEEDAKGALSVRDRERSERSPGCRCVVI